MPAAQHTLTTKDAYAETNFPFKISAGAMTFISPLPTMDTAKTKVRLPTLLRGAAQTTCLETAQQELATASALPPLLLGCACAVQGEVFSLSGGGVGRVEGSRKMKELCDDGREEMTGWWKEPLQMAPSCGAGIPLKRGSGLHSGPW